MTYERSYRIAFFGACVLHVLIASLLFYKSEPPHKAYSVTKNNRKPPELSTPIKAVQAISVDQQVLSEAVQRLKEERLEQQRQEAERQRTLEKRMQAARSQRLLEEKRLKNLKAKEKALAKVRSQKIAQEKRQLEALAKQQSTEKNRLAQMKREQAAEQERLKSLRAEKKAELERRRKAQAERERIEREQQRQIAAQKAKEDSEKQASIANAVDKYKGLIINAISREWILPDNLAPNISSQFRIRLAPTGMVLDVHLIRSSGDPILDRSAQSAIYKASPLPVPSDPEIFHVFRDISLTVRPETVRG